ncbi:MAG: DUF4251 domain-containing protein [Bacteroidales bacterium]|nr:DUF4251 domain-containing protein [Bacteroidales bacterium]
MKRILITLMAAALLFQGCGVLNESREDRLARLEREAQMVRDGVENGDFKVDIDRMIPLRGGSRHVDNYSVKVKDGHIVSYLPYFGRAWDLPYGGGHGLNFEADIQESEVYREADGSYTVRLLIKTDEDTHVYTFQIFTNGSTSLLVQSKNREPINFNGDFSFEKEDDK